MPGLDQFTSATLSAGTNDLGRATADVDIPVDGLGTPAAARVNLMADTNGVAERDLVNFNRPGPGPQPGAGPGQTDARGVQLFLPGRA